MELGEHELVVKQLTPLDGGRRAFRLANGVLMERTVAEVLPDLTGTAENVREFLRACMYVGVGGSKVGLIRWFGVVARTVMLMAYMHASTTSTAEAPAAAGGPAAGAEAAGDSRVEGISMRARAAAHFPLL